MVYDVDAITEFLNAACEEFRQHSKYEGAQKNKFTKKCRKVRKSAEK
jgi:hypothetical protein